MRTKPRRVELAHLLMRWYAKTYHLTCSAANVTARKSASLGGRSAGQSGKGSGTAFIVMMVPGPFITDLDEID